MSLSIHGVLSPVRTAAERLHENLRGHSTFHRHRRGSVPKRCTGKEGVAFAAVAGNKQILTILENKLWLMMKLPEPAAHQHPSRE